MFFGSESHKMNSPCIINHKATARKLISRHYDYLNEEVVANDAPASVENERKSL